MLISGEAISALPISAQPTIVVGGGTTYNKSIAGSIAMVGALLTNISLGKSLSGSITASGALAASVALSKSLAGSISMAAALATQLYNAVVGSVAARYYTLRRFLGRR